MVIGDIAHLVWGQPRRTLAIDVTVPVPTERIHGIAEMAMLLESADIMGRCHRWKAEAGRTDQA